LIEEGILGKCLRCSSSLSGLRISPLTLKYVFPRLPSFIPEFPRSEERRRGEPQRRSRKPIISNELLKPTKAKTVIRRMLRCYPMLSNSCRMDCFGRTFLVTVMNTDVPRRALLANQRETIPWYQFLMFSGNDRDFPSPYGREEINGNRIPQFNYEPFNSNSVNIRSWSWNYRGCWHQTCPPIVTRCWMVLNIPHWKPRRRTPGAPISFRCLIICFGIGQFARLLPSVEVVAISQAPSPESNPNPPLPSKPWQSTTRPSLADRAVVPQKAPINRLSREMS
jgi:hypothetical protein